MNTLPTIEWLFSLPVVERLGWVLVHSLWQFSLVALLAGVMLRVMRRSSSTMRYGVLLVALAVSIAAPVATWMLMPSDVPAPFASRPGLGSADRSIDAVDPGADAARLPSDAMLASDGGMEVPTPHPAVVSDASKSRATVSSSTAIIIQPEPSWSERAKTVLRPWLAWIVVAWSLGVVVCSARPLLGWYTLRRLRHMGVSPVSDEVLAALHRVSARLGLRSAVRLLQSTLARVPIVVGYLRPAILLPVSVVTSIPAAQLEAILAHELAHVRRNDFIVNLLQTLVETFFFYHPAVWWLSRQIRVEREHCCDDLVVKLLGDRVEYGRALVAIEQLRGTNSVLALGATDGSLLSRVRRIVGFNSKNNVTSAVERWPAAVFGLALLGAILLLNLNWGLSARDESKEISVSEQPAESANKLEFLAAYPKLSGLALGMTEARFKAIARRAQLVVQTTPSAGGKSKYSIPTGDDHTVMVMFDNGKCSGIQRVRGGDILKQVTFDSLSVAFKNSFRRRQAEQIEIKANGDCVYHIDELPSQGTNPKRPEARLMSKVDPQQMLELERLLAETNWLKRAQSEPSAPPLHSDETPLTVVRDGVTTTVKCFAPRDESYQTLLWILRGIAKQEHFVYTLDWVGDNATERKLALIELRFGVEALEERPGRALPDFDLDYNRLLPTFSRMLRNPNEFEEEILTAIKVATFVRADSELEFIARLKHDRNSNVRNAVATAIADFGGDRAIPLLVEMISSSEEARWGLIRLGDISVPALVKLIEPGTTASDITSEHVVRAYLDHRKELTGKVDARIIAAVRQALTKTTARSQRTEYFKEFLQLVEQRQAEPPGAIPKPLARGAQTSLADELQFLQPYPKLHGLSLDMTEPQFLEIVKQQELKTRKTVDGGKVQHHIGLGDDHTLIVMFDKDAKCVGIQRVRGEEREPIRVMLKLNRKEFLLGESIAVDYEMTNDGTQEAPFGKGGFYPDLRINDGFRMSAVKVDENGKQIGEPVATWPMPPNFGGPKGNFELKPGEKFSTILVVTRYLKFLEPGRYRLRVENVDRLERKPKKAYSSGETYLALKQPTPQEARRVFEQMKQAPRKAYDDNAMKFLPEAADFQAMHQPVYLPTLKEFAAKSDRDAFESLERMERLDANEVLVATLANALDRDDWRTARVCFQHLKKSLPFPNWFNKPLSEYDQPNRDRVARLWKADFGTTLARLAKRLNVEITSLMRDRKSKPLDADANDREFLKVFRNGYFPPEHPQSLLIDIDFIYRCVGQPKDFSDCLAAFAHSIALTKTLPLETNQYFRPRGSASGFGHTVMYMLRRGAKAPDQPAHPGEAAAFAIALRTQDSFRPAGWQAELMKWLKSDSPYLAEVILDHLPDPIPAEVLDYLPTALAHDYIDLQIAACHVAKKSPRPVYREPLQKILDSAKDVYLRKYAVDAARANGINAKYDANAPFVDAEKENAAATVPPVGVRTLRKPALLLPDHWIVMSVGFDNDGKELVTASRQSFATIRRWDIVGKKLISEIKLEGDKHGREFREGTFMLSGDRRRVIAATDAYVGIWETATGKLLTKLPIPRVGDNDTVRILTCTPDFSVIVGSLETNYSRTTLVYDAHTVVWDGTYGKMLRINTHKHQNHLIAITLSPDGRRFATTNGGGANIWDTSTGERLVEVPNDNSGRKHSNPETSSLYTNHVWSIQFSPSGRQLAIGDILGVKLVDATSGKLLQQLEGPYSYSSGQGRSNLVFSKDGQLLARMGTGDSSGGARTGYVVPIWSTQSGQKQFELHTGSNDGAFSDDGQQFAVGFADLQMALAVWPLSGNATGGEQTEGPGPESRKDKVEENGHYHGKKAAEFIDTFKPMWGDAKLGVQYGIALTKPQRQFRIGERVPLVVFFRNASDEPLKIDMRPDFFGNTPKVLDAKGAAVEFENVSLLGSIPHYVENLEPGEAVGPFYLNFGLGVNPRPGKQNWHPYYKTPAVGKYKLTHSVSIDVVGLKDGDKSKRDQINSSTIEFEIVDGVKTENKKIGAGLRY